MVVQQGSSPQPSFMGQINKDHNDRRRPTPTTRTVASTTYCVAFRATDRNPFASIAASDDIPMLCVECEEESDEAVTLDHCIIHGEGDGSDYFEMSFSEVEFCTFVLLPKCLFDCLAFSRSGLLPSSSKGREANTKCSDGEMGHTLLLAHQTSEGESSAPL